MIKKILSSVTLFICVSVAYGNIRNDLVFFDIQVKELTQKVEDVARSQFHAKLKAKLAELKEQVEDIRDIYGFEDKDRKFATILDDQKKIMTDRPIGSSLIALGLVNAQAYKFIGAYESEFTEHIKFLIQQEEARLKQILMIRLFPPEKINTIDAKQFQNNDERINWLATKEAEINKLPLLPADKANLRKTLYQKFLESGNNLAPTKKNAEALINAYRDIIKLKVHTRFSRKTQNIQKFDDYLNLLSWLDLSIFLSSGVSNAIAHSTDPDVKKIYEEYLEELKKNNQYNEKYQNDLKNFTLPTGATVSDRKKELDSRPISKIDKEWVLQISLNTLPRDEFIKEMGNKINNLGTAKIEAIENANKIKELLSRFNNNDNLGDTYQQLLEELAKAKAAARATAP